MADNGGSATGSAQRISHDFVLFDIPLTMGFVRESDI